MAKQMHFKIDSFWPDVEMDIDEDEYPNGTITKEHVKNVRFRSPA